MNDPLFLARRIAERQEIDAASERWLVPAISAWVQDGCDPSRLGLFLRLPTAARAAVAERDRWLAVAASELPESNRAVELKRRTGEFMRNT